MNMGPSAWRYAESMKKYFTEISETPDWELAFVYAIHAWAALACGKLDEYKASYLKARSWLEAIQDPEDRAVVMKTFNLIPNIWGSKSNLSTNTQRFSVLLKSLDFCMVYKYF